jgi:hypothetical protein
MLQYHDQHRPASSRLPVSRGARRMVARQQRRLDRNRGKSQMSSPSVHARAPSMSVATLAMAFVAGVVATLVFHQLTLWILHHAGIVPFAPFNMAPTKPLGVPDVVSLSFWGGVWGVLFQLTLPRWFKGNAYWIAAIVAGGIFPTLVFMFVVFPLKFGGMPPDLVGLFIIGFILNAAWGLGWALFMALFQRLRGA